MKLLPFIVSKPYEVKILEHSVKVYRIAFLLANGTDLWQEDSSIGLNEILTINDLYEKRSIHTSDGIDLIAIDLDRTKIGDFYFYNEPDAPTDGLVWRSFFYLCDTSTNTNFMDGWKYLPAISKNISNALKLWLSI